MSLRTVGFRAASRHAASKLISRRKSRVDACPKVTPKVTRRCLLRVSAGQKVTSDLTGSHAPRSQKSHVFPPLFRRGKRDFSDPAKIANCRLERTLRRPDPRCSDLNHDVPGGD